MAGLMEQILGGVLGGGIGRKGGGGRGRSAVTNGLLVTLAAQAAQHYMRQRGQGRSFSPGQGPGMMSEEAGGLPGGLGAGLPGGLGGMLGGLGGAGALGALLGQLRERGLGSEVDSWVRPGPNQPLQPQRLAEALGDDTVASLEAETGTPRQALLAELAQTLPGAVDELTPEGREPSDDDLHRIGRA